ncbi:MAG: DNA or RNA helicases of superfamily II [Candidatus Aramenus sulfurataquae]|uniref:RNA helicase n=1 Tax=Candidatus Aramenus sulfurataquae TaxID=1326980 RepID=W7KUB0_9CREN|nr:MAG: DNA or RNA helicases of superfamily II [Candidatus Aramenus sulfurataquae]
MEFSEFNERLKKSLGFSMFPYQEYVSRDLIRALELNYKFVIVSMPTGSGKTVVELFMVYYLLKRGFKNATVMEPTRILCDQMYRQFWKAVFDDVGEEYEGECDAFNEGKSVVVSTPFTANKCNAKADVVILDEVHHAFGDPRYTEALINATPKVVLGFTALLPSYKKYKLDPRISSFLGDPVTMNYDFRTLAKVDPSFKPPKAIADLFDAEMDSLENNVFEVFFRGKVKGNRETAKFLEYTLYSYGKVAFCESLERLRDKVQDDHSFFVLCDSEGFSHKARTLQEVFSIYKVEDYKPVLVFTSRKSTAYEFEKAIKQVAKARVEVLTGDLTKEERQSLVEEAKKGEVDVIVSTLVGEEGIDIPEAKLLVMTDVPQSPLRFYQRLGRLIRNKREEEQKYLVVSLTPKTPEYDNLDDALRNLYAEGVDVSYILEKKEDKGPTARVLDALREQGSTLVPFESLDEEVKLQADGDEDKFLFNLLTSTVSGKEGSFTTYVEKAMRDGKVLYIYDVEEMGKVLFKVLLGKYCSLCYGEKCKRLCNDWLIKIGFLKNVKLEKKSLLRHYMRLFSRENLQKVEEELREEVEKAKSALEGLDYSLSVTETSNKTFTSLVETLNFNVSLEGMTIYPKVSISFYNMKESGLAKLNALAIGYKALSNLRSSISE